MAARLLPLVAVGAAAATSRGLLEGEVLPAGDITPNGWRVGARCSDETMSLSFLLRHDDEQMRILEHTLFAVSDPSSARYGRHLTLDEVTKIAALPEAARRVSEWLLNQGYVTPSLVRNGANQDTVEVDTLPCSLVERLFETQIHHYHHKHLELCHLQKL